jgi:hypothetical protein
MYCPVFECTLTHGRYEFLEQTSVTLFENSTGSFIVKQTSVPLTSSAFSLIPFQAYMLLNDTSRPTFNAVSHK